MHNERKTWHVGDVITIATDLLVSPPGRGAHRELREYMADRPLSNEDLLMYGGAFAEAVRNQYPLLGRYSDKDYPPEEFLDEWLARRAAEYGEYLPVDRLPDEWAPGALIGPLAADQSVGRVR